MGLAKTPKTIFKSSLTLARTPIDAALKATGKGGPDSPATRAIDRLEASAHAAAGAIFGDDELRRDGQRLSVAAKERQRARALREEAVRTEREEAQELAEQAERARRESAKLDRSARLEEVEARERSLDAKEAAARTGREAKKVGEKAAKAKKARKKNAGGGAT